MNKEIHFFRVVNAKLSQGNTATIIVSSTSLENLEFYKLRYCIKWTEATGAEVLKVQVGISSGKSTPASYPVLDKNTAEPVLIGRLRRRELLCLKFVNPNTSSSLPFTPHFVLMNDLHPQCLRTKKDCDCD